MQSVMAGQHCPLPVLTDDAALMKPFGMTFASDKLSPTPFPVEHQTEYDYGEEADHRLTILR